jgi:hypothetical protein
MNSFIKQSLPLLALVTLLSCGGDDPEPAAGNPTFLKVGMKYTFYYDDGLFNSDSLYTIVEKQLATDTFLVRHNSETIAVGNTQYWTVKDNDLYSSIRLRDPSTYIIECRFGQPVGTTWEVVKAGTHFTYSIDALDVPITTGDGVVNDAIKVKIKATSGQESFQYFSPTVGLLGNGSIDENASMKLIHYKIGTIASVNGSTPKITFGSFPFLAVGKYWNYFESTLWADVEVNLSIESKISNNIYKVKLIYNGTASYSYWYEDNGMLMAYDEGETYLNADPIYMKDNIATVGYGWASITPNNTMYLYKITALNQTTGSYFGDLPCTVINVTDGWFSSQDNYWNANKGNVLVGGMVSRDVVASNARKNAQRASIPVITY